jgi:nitrogen fixation NifU-like protein
MTDPLATQYSDKVIAHFLRPLNAGFMENADGIGEIGDPDCGDFLRVYIKIENHRVSDVRYQIKGCPAAIACASAMTELAIGKDLSDAMMLSDDDIVRELDGLPEFKVHCSALGAAGLQEAILDYYLKKETKGKSK